jgi:DNA (cytosine-5)-methyltransferase 1
MSKTAKKNKPTVVSLFAGCGGLDLGFLDAGYKILWANDFDKDAVSTYRKNVGEIDDRNVKEIKLDEVPKADVLLAGFPCQPFSNAGKRRGVNDSRGTLFFDALKFIRAKQPKVVMFENVRGLLSIKNADGTKLIDRIVGEISKGGKNYVGYNVRYELLNASDYEVPQNRHRVFIVGVRKDLDKFFEFPPKIQKKNLELKYVLKNLPKNDVNDEHWELSPQSKSLIQHIPAGGSWKSISDKHLPPRLMRIKADMKRYHAPNFYRRFDLNETCGTITAAATPENSGIVHPLENRRYTIREIARIQSFPDWFIFQGNSVASKYKIIGNAVPPKFAFHIATAIKEQIFRK